MNIFERDSFETFAGNLPHGFIVHQWGGASVAKVGSGDRAKIFAIFSDGDGDGPAISFKCSDMSFDLLKDEHGVRPAPYLARAKWVEVEPEAALDADLLSAYIVQAHALAFQSLPKTLRIALGPIA
ncbi:MmcQ/YjbR family DNA-binding protein [Pelagibacterium limicola]|uniref:MmcQ/YjbR family DNA-binding protein n=1 Tax=Pelagibacterium limicola TaxID=2791022 RepID=UPI0018B00A24|nr:MmcQ/YjbR family DNA-binding protein [Pelagibacterium limicola]